MEIGPGNTPESRGKASHQATSLLRAPESYPGEEPARDPIDHHSGLTMAPVSYAPPQFVKLRVEVPVFQTVGMPCTMVIDVPAVPPQTATSALPGSCLVSVRRPWHGKPRIPDLICGLGILVSMLYLLAITALTPSLIASHPMLRGRSRLVRGAARRVRVPARSMGYRSRRSDCPVCGRHARTGGGDCANASRVACMADGEAAQQPLGCNQPLSGTGRRSAHRKRALRAGHAGCCARLPWGDLHSGP